MKNMQKKKIIRNYHLLTKVQSGKCRGVTAAIDIICHVKSRERGKTSLQCPSGGQRLGIQSRPHNSDHAAAKTVWRLGKYFFFSDHHL